MNLRISNIDRLTSEDDIMQICEEFGDVASVELNEEPDPGLETFSAIVEMEYEDDARELMEELNGEQVDGRFLRVEEFTESEEDKMARKKSLENLFDLEEEWDDTTFEPIERKRPREAKEVSKPPKKRRK